MWHPLRGVRAMVPSLLIKQSISQFFRFVVPLWLLWFFFCFFSRALTYLFSTYWRGLVEVSLFLYQCRGIHLFHRSLSCLLQQGEILQRKGKLEFTLKLSLSVAPPYGLRRVTEHPSGLTLLAMLVIVHYYIAPSPTSWLMFVRIPPCLALIPPTFGLHCPLTVNR